MRVLLGFFTLIFFSCNNANDTGKAGEPRQESRHRAEFNNNIENALTSYDQLTLAFVSWDSASIPSKASELNSKLDSLQLLPETGGKEHLSAAQSSLALIMDNRLLDEKRQALNQFSDHLFQYLRSVQYDRKEIFLQECPMAFNDTGSGIWISGADTIRNPYLGMHHPKYGKGMLRCGENKDRINFTGK